MCTLCSKRDVCFNRNDVIVYLTQDFLTWVQSVNPEHSVPECWETERQLSECVVHSLCSSNLS